MKTQKSISIEEFKKMAISKVQTTKIKGGDSGYRGNAAIIVDWN